MYEIAPAAVWALWSPSPQGGAFERLKQSAAASGSSTRGPEGDQQKPVARHDEAPMK